MIVSASVQPSDLPAVLRHLRKESGLKLAEVAAGVGISVSYLSDLEHGRRDFPLTGKVAAVLSFYGYQARIKLVKG